MTLLKFELAPHVLQFSIGSSYPSTRRHEVLQVADRTASGMMQIETLGISIETRTLNFIGIPKADYDGLRNWYYNVVNGQQKTFLFTDEYGVTSTVFIADSQLEFEETSMCRFSGTLNLEYVNA